MRKTLYGVAARQWLFCRTFVHLVPFLVFLLSGTVHAGHEIPTQGQIVSGNNIVSGWFCVAQVITIQFDELAEIEVPYGAQRNDTIPVCGDANNAYTSIIGYGTLGDGEHRLRVRVDGVVRADLTFTVVTFGVENLQGVTGEGSVILSNGQTAMVQWSEGVQGFVVVEVIDSPASDFSGIWFLDVRLASNSCAFVATSGLAAEMSGAVEVIQVGSSITIYAGPGVVWTGSVKPDGEFVVSRLFLRGDVGACTYMASDIFEGNFSAGVIANVFDYEAVSSATVCAGAGLLCMIEYSGTMSLVSSLSLGESGASVGWPDIASSIQSAILP